jgi:hypothetical protein
MGPVASAGRVGLAPSTVHRILVSCRINRLWQVDRITGEPIRRYEMSRPGELVHVDIKKLGNIPDGGGWRIHGKAKGIGNRQAHRDPARPVAPPQGIRAQRLRRTVKATRASRGTSTSTSRRLCSRAPRTRMKWSGARFAGASTTAAAVIAPSP